MAATQGHQAQAEIGPWGLWATAGLSAIIGVVFVAVQLITQHVFSSLYNITGPRVLEEEVFGLLVAWATSLAAPVGVALTVIFAALRKGMSIATYLALKPPKTVELIRWFFYLVLFIVVVHAITFVLGKPFVTDFEAKIFETAHSIPFLVVALCVAAPVFEELFIRGFIFQGISFSRIGPRGAVVLTSLLWSIFHLQYDFIEIAMIFAGGLLFGYARLKTQSIYASVAMHSMWNLISAIETMILLG